MASRVMQIQIPGGGVVARTVVRPVVLTKWVFLHPSSWARWFMQRPQRHLRCRDSVSRQDVARLVGGDDQHTVQQLLHRQRLTLHDVGGAAVLRPGRARAVAVAVTCWSSRSSPRSMASRDQQSGHDLGDAGSGQLDRASFCAVEHRARSRPSTSSAALARMAGSSSGGRRERQNRPASDQGG